MTRYAGLPPLPTHRPSRRARGQPLVELAVRPSQGLPRSRLPALARDRAQPHPHAAARLARAPRADGARSRVPPDLRRCRRRARRGIRGEEHLDGAAVQGPADSHHRVLLGRVRDSPVAADLRGRPRRARGRSLQAGQRPRRSAGRRRLHVSRRATSTRPCHTKAGSSRSTSGSTGPTWRSNRP